MELERFLSIMDEKTCFEIDGRLFFNKDLSEDIKKQALEKVFVENNRLVLMLAARENQAKTLEELKYSFDVGM